MAELKGLAANLQAMQSQGNFTDERQWTKIEATEMEMLSKRNGEPMLEIIVNNIDGVAVNNVRVLVTYPAQKIPGKMIPAAKYVRGKDGVLTVAEDQYNPKAFYPMRFLLVQLKDEEFSPENGDTGTRISRIEFPSGLRMKSISKMEYEIVNNDAVRRRAENNNRYNRRQREIAMTANSPMGYVPQQVQQPVEVLTPPVDQPLKW